MEADPATPATPATPARGPGTCPATHAVRMGMPTVLVTDGRPAAFFGAAFRAVHQYNRDAALDDFVAIALPRLDLRATGLDRLGGEIALYGSAAALRAVLETHALARAVGTRPLDNLAPAELPAPGADGVALVRDRSWARHSLGELRRRRRRLEARGSPLEKIDTEIAALQGAGRRLDRSRVSPGEMFVPVAKTLLGFRAETRRAEDRARVTTFGLSRPDAPFVARAEAGAERPPAFALAE